MKLAKSGLLLGTICLAAASVVSPTTRADDSGRQATVTIQSPEQVPGSVLPAGTYVFKQTGMQSGWFIVQIYNNDGSALVTTVLAYPNPKVASNGLNFVTYPANGSGSIPAMEGVVFAGDSTVEQFAYPKTAADQIGEANHTRIPTTGTDDAYPSALPDAATSWSAPVMNNSRADNTSSSSASSSAAPVMEQTSAQTSLPAQQQSLPATASPLPLIALVGLFSIVGIVILRKALARP
jgi:hypothetical protein